MEYRQHRDTGVKPTRFYSNRQESQVASTIGGRKTANSGATPYSKGDVETDLFLLECKTQIKDKESFTIHKNWFDKNVEESIYMKKPYSAVVVNFGPSSKNYYIVDENTFLDMKAALESQYNNEKE